MNALKKYQRTLKMSTHIKNMNALLKYELQV